MRAIFGADKIYHISCEYIGKVITIASLDEAMSTMSAMSGKGVALVGHIPDLDEMEAYLDRVEGFGGPRWVCV
jgi:hypothetical protein